MSAALRRAPPMDVSEFLAWDPEDGMRYELVDGEPRAMAPTSNVHGYLQAELGSLIRNHLRARGSPCDVVSNPGVVPRLLAARNFRIPDLGVTCSDLGPGQRWLEEPLLLIEFVSPSNRADTWSNVWLYTTIASVAEILVLDTMRVAGEALRRGPDGQWPDKPEPIGSADQLAMASIEFRVAMQELYARTGLAD